MPVVISPSRTSRVNVPALHRRFGVLPLLVFLALPGTPASAQESMETLVGGFVDVYYAYSLQSHALRERSFTTQPLRHNEFSLNLGVVEIVRRGGAVRGRIALQTGTYVQSNLAAEPELLKHVLEASAGARLADGIWVDLGIFPSHIGFEGILSRDNWTYSRSLLADYSPYYESGISVTAEISGRLTARGLILNGWQNIQENNDAKAAGAQIQFRPSDDVLLNWSSFAGNEQPDSVSSLVRFFNDVYCTIQFSPEWSAAAVFDVGVQQGAPGSPAAVWHGASLMARRSLGNPVSVTSRLEYFSDERGIVAPTGTSNNFRIIAGSVNFDVRQTTVLLWRIEGRLFRSADRIYPSRSGPRRVDGFLVLSVSVSL